METEMRRLITAMNAAIGRNRNTQAQLSMKGNPLEQIKILQC